MQCLQKVITTTTKSLQSCPTLCDPIDGSPPGSPAPGILQARTLEWAAISFSNAGKWKGKVKSLSCVWLFATPWTAAYQAPLSMGFFQARVLEWGAIAFCESVIHTYICSFSYSFPLWPITGYWISFPVLCTRTLLFTRPIYTRLHLLIPNSHPIPLPPTSPWQPQVCSPCLFLLHRYVHSCRILDFTCKW